MRISEIFGHSVEDQSAAAWHNRTSKHCRFRNSPCTKASKKNPLGICSLSDGRSAAALCPVRFVERDKIFKDAAHLAFGEGVAFGVFPEIRVLKIEREGDDENDRKIGKVDYLLGRIESGAITDFAAVEVQAVYFSGTEIRSAFDHFLTHKSLDEENSDRRPDFRSSAQKRLIPQLQLKIPVFRRWGKKFFVVVDQQFFGSLPSFSHTTQANSELTWLVYRIENSGQNYSLSNVDIIHSEWDEVRNALREGTPPEPAEIVAELQKKLGNRRRVTRLLQT